MIKNKEISYEEIEILPDQGKKGATGEIITAIWKQQRVVIKKVNKYSDPVVCSKHFVHEVSITSINEAFNI